MSEDDLREAIANVINEASVTGWRRSRPYSDDELREAVDEILELARGVED
jgi:hypothetical protein